MRVYAYILSIFLMRRIVIRSIQTTGEANFWQTSFQATLSTFGQRINLEFLRAAPEDSKLFRVALAIKIAEDICKERFLPTTPVFIKTDKDVVVVLVKEN